MIKPIITIQREKSTSNGIIGTLIYNGHTYKTLELPYKKNQKYISSIPTGTYYGDIRKSRKNGWCIQLQKVKNRSAIQIHAGNKIADTRGCILLGLTSTRTTSGEYLLANSKYAIRTLLNQLPIHETFKIIISNQNT